MRISLLYGLTMKKTKRLLMATVVAVMLASSAHGTLSACSFFADCGFMGSFWKQYDAVEWFLDTYIRP